MSKNGRGSRLTFFLLAAIATLALGVQIAHGQQDSLLWPISGSSSQRDIITSPFGVRQWPSGRYDWHRGVDIRTWDNRYIHASRRGYKTDYDHLAGYGTVLDMFYFGESIGVDIQHRYAHLDSVYLDILNPWLIPVYRGDTIAFAGNTGGPYAVHLHLEFQALQNESSGWVGTRERRNAVQLYPLPENEDASPSITNVTYWFDPVFLDSLRFSVVIDADEMDLRNVSLKMRDPETGFIHIILYALSREFASSGCVNNNETDIASS